MSVQFIGFISHQEVSEALAPTGPLINKAWIRAVAQAHEYAGFDRALVAYGSTMPDAIQIAAYAAQHTKKLNLLIAHRPGFSVPTLAARNLATLDQFSGGRVAVHIITGGSDAEQQRDGDFLDHDQRYRRTDEYLSIARKTWTSAEPFDYAGEFYQIKGNVSAIKPVQQPHLPIFFGGSSDIAIDIAGKHADVYALWGEPLAAVAETIAKVRAAAVRHGRAADAIKFSLSLRPILAETEDAAWAKADRILDAARERVQHNPLFAQRGAPQNVGSQRLLQAAEQGAVVDQRLWTEIAKLTGAAGNSTSLVGTAEQVADSLIEYYKLGITTFLIRGFDPLQDALQYGRELLPLVRTKVAALEQTKAKATELTAA
ncbi:LLM class flavin-dependent oxidoreductase [Silvimonas sp. JCM 19000]